MTENYRKAGQVLARALFDISYYQAISVEFGGSDAARQDCLARYFEYSMLEGSQIGAAVCPEPEIFGAAIWSFPQHPDVQRQADEQKSAFLAGLLGKQGFANLESISSFMHQRTLRVTSPAWWYLSILGVAPELQNKGLGEGLLRPTLAEADRTGVTCYVETFTPRNIRFYNRCGFVEAASHFEPVTQTQYWILVCSPQPG